MAQKSTFGNLVALATGIVAGAAAVFLAKKENRELAKEELTKAGKKLEKMKSEAEKDPQKFTKKVKAQGKKLAKKVVKDVSKKAQEVEKVAVKKAVKVKPAAVKIEKAVVNKVKTSPVLKVVGKK